MKPAKFNPKRLKRDLLRLITYVKLISDTNQSEIKEVARVQSCSFDKEGGEIK